MPLRHLDKQVLPNIAWLAERLRIGAIASSTHEDWQDVIQDQILWTATPLAGSFLPFSPLQSRPFCTVTALNRALVIGMVLSSRQRSKAFISIDLPVSFHAFTLRAPFFGPMDIPFFLVGAVFHTTMAPQAFL